MKKIIVGFMMIVSSVISLGALAGSGSGNPKNDLGYYTKYDNTPRYIWKDGKLVSNPKYSTSKEAIEVSQK